ncbi:MAG: YbhB/YbcL family Raf kinase inhibitor-like protein [Sulfobacillus sp.]
MRPASVALSVCVPALRLVMFDLDSPERTSFLHWVITNLSIPKSGHGNVAIPYMGPRPPAKQVHRYVFELYRQRRPAPHLKLGSRQSALSELISEIGLTPIARATMKVGST